MKVSHTRGLVINMGNYGERYQASATASVDHTDLGYTDEEWAEYVRSTEDAHPGEGTARAARKLQAEAIALVNAALDIEITEADRIRTDEASLLDQYTHPTLKKRKPRNRS